MMTTLVCSAHTRHPSRFRNITLIGIPQLHILIIHLYYLGFQYTHSGARFRSSLSYLEFTPAMPSGNFGGDLTYVKLPKCRTNVDLPCRRYSFSADPIGSRHQLFPLPSHERQQHSLTHVTGSQTSKLNFLSQINSERVLTPPYGRPLEDGDIVNIDVTVYIGGYHGDTSRTFIVGDVVSFSSSPQPPLYLSTSRTGRAGKAAGRHHEQRAGSHNSVLWPGETVQRNRKGHSYISV